MRIDHFTPIDATLKELGRRLAVSRNAQGLSQDDLAKAAGIGVATLRRIETGSDGNMGTWVKTLRALGDIGAIEGLLPEEVRSPMAEAKTSKKRRSRKQASSAWGSEAP